MILPLLHLSGLLAWTTPVMAETVWWHTEGGTVTERHDNTITSCELKFEDGAHSRSIIFEWQSKVPFHVMLWQSNWDYPRNTALSSSMQIGRTSLGSDIVSMGYGPAIVFLLTQPIEDLLLAGDLITVNTKDDGKNTSEFSLQLPSHAKIASLIIALHQCRKATQL